MWPDHQDRRWGWWGVRLPRATPQGAILKGEVTQAEMHVGLAPSNRWLGRSWLRSQNSGPRRGPVALRALTQLCSPPVAGDSKPLW